MSGPAKSLRWMLCPEKHTYWLGLGVGVGDLSSPGCPRVMPVPRQVAKGPARLGGVLQEDMPCLRDSLRATLGSRSGLLGHV
ncbi:unnamed protein product, partial [Gulo gulo]